MKTRRLTYLAVIGLAAGAVAVSGATGATAGSSRVLEFSNQMDVMTPVDVSPAGPSAGDQFYVDSHVVAGDVTGRTSAACVLVKPHGGGLRQCEIDFILADGIITTRGLVPGLAPTTPVHLVVTGGKGAYLGAGGGGTLTPTPGGSTVTLRLR